jgi:hypothetical protein
MSEVVRVASPRGAIVFEDSRDHFENGVLRLLGFTPEGFADWVAAAEDVGGPDLLASLGVAFAGLRPEPPTPAADASRVEPGPAGEPGRLWHAAIAESPSHGFALDAEGTFAWLVRPEDGGFRRETEPPAYEESYFEDVTPGTAAVVPSMWVADMATSARR